MCPPAFWKTSKSGEKTGTDWAGNYCFFCGESGRPDSTQKGLVDRHVAGGGGRAIEQQAGGEGHGERLR